MKLFNSVVPPGAAIMLSLISCQKHEKVKKPNILFILADDLGYTDLSCMGSKYYETPNIDQIALAGLPLRSEQHNDGISLLPLLN